MNPIEASTLTSQGQISIPKKIREKLHLEKGDRVVFLEDEEGRIFIQELEMPVSLSAGEWDLFLKKTQSEPKTRVKGKKAALAHLERLESKK